MSLKNVLKRTDWGKLIVSVLACQAAGLAGAFFTASSVGSWYQTLNKPEFTPPSWVFGPVWTILYFLMAFAAYKIWILGWDNIKVKIGLVLFLIQLILNAAWSFSFFGLQNPYVGLLNIVILLVMITVTTIYFFSLRKISGWLMVPYIAWVGYATALNYAIYELNAPITSVHFPSEYFF
ncbi:TspO/MBR family protein [Roseivirga sp. BDSF3-8]|uniref:TspO/MBR family protein n=1 Tax=Roseivirga sp. BDSF3-8 TaxID=3241598 RepID=UPI003531B9BB